MYASAACDCVLLDDPSSALDIVTATSLIDYLTQKVSLIQQRLVIISTSQPPSFFQNAVDGVVVLKPLDQGGPLQISKNDIPKYFESNNSHRMSQTNRLQSNLSPENLATKSVSVLSHKVDADDTIVNGNVITSNFNVKSEVSVVKAIVETTNTDSTALSPPCKDVVACPSHTASSSSASSSSSIDALQLEEDEQREALEFMETGRIDSSVYLAYVRSAGWALSAAVLLSTLLMQVSVTCMGLW